MAVEAKRGCGYRKVGGLYLVGGGIGKACDRLPLLLEICPTCGGGIKQSRGFTWVDVAGLFEGPHVNPDGPDGDPWFCGCGKGGREQNLFEAQKEGRGCPLCLDPKAMGRAGLLWIGEGFYKTPTDFLLEGAEMGISRRLASVPNDFKVGETWVLLAHPKTIRTVVADGEPGKLFTEVQNTKVVFKPGIFFVWRPQRLEKIMLESQRGSEEIAKLEKRGITPVFVPDNDTDHQGSVHDYEPDETSGS